MSSSARPLSVPPSSPPLKVLVVDDEEANRLLAVRWLERAGLSTSQAHSGEVALSQLRATPHEFGAILLDLMMPTMNGYDVLAALQADEDLQPIPVVILTAHAQEERDVVLGLERGALDQLAKPFRGPILTAKMRALVERRAAQLRLSDQLKIAEARAATDPLTGLLNRQQFEADLRREMSYCTRHRAPLALVLVDIDEPGRSDGMRREAQAELAVYLAAQGLRANMRSSDRGFRIGEEQFAVLLRGSDRDNAVTAAQRFIKTRADRSFDADGEGATQVSVRAGVAVADTTNGFDVSELVGRAGRALFAAKSSADRPVQVE